MCCFVSSLLHACSTSWQEDRVGRSQAASKAQGEQQTLLEADRSSGCWELCAPHGSLLAVLLCPRSTGAAGVPTASNAFRPPSSLGSLAHKLLWGHRPLQAARTEVTVRTFVFQLHMGCPLPPSSLQERCSKPGQEKADWRETQTDGVWWSLIHPVPSSFITPLTPCGFTGAQHVLCSLLGSVSIRHRSTQFRKRAAEREN